MKNMTLEAIAKVCGGTCRVAEELLQREIAGAVVDSRQIQKDYLFFATPGERVDGHDYIPNAFASGALAVVCQRIPEGVEGPCIVVEDSFLALKQVAKLYREQLSIKVVGITGSVGKTSTKEFIASVLSQKYQVLKTAKNYNNEVGLPLTVLRIREKDEIAVLEMGISDFGEMSRLAEIAKPDIAVITNIGQCHLEKLHDRDGVLKAKTEVFDYLQADGTVCLLANDDKLRTIKEVKGKSPIFFGTEEDAPIHTKEIVNRGLYGSECIICTPECEFQAKIPLPGVHMVYNALAATAVGTLFNMTSEEIAQGIAEVQTVAGRSNIIHANDITVIDDCYNANPISMCAALDLLKEALTRKVAILGDMFELGEDTQRMHADVGTYAIKKQIDVLICVGELGKAMYTRAHAEAKETGETIVYYFADKKELFTSLFHIIRKEDAILVKASHGMQFTEIVEVLTDVKNAERITTFVIPARNTKSEEEKESMQEEEKKEETAVKKEETVVEKEESKENKEDAAKKVALSEEVVDGADLKVVQTTEEIKAAVAKEEEAKKKRILIVAIAIAVLAIAITVTILIVNANHYRSMTQGVLFYQNAEGVSSADFMGDPIYSEDPNTWAFADEDSEIVMEDFGGISTDGKYVCYTTDVQNGTFTLHCAKKSGAKETVVAEKVSDYELTNQKKVYYLLDGGLYCYNIKEGTTQKACSDITDFVIDNKKQETALVLNTESGDLSLLSLVGEQNPQLLETGVQEILAASADFSNIIYWKDDTLYALAGLQDKTKIAQGAIRVDVYHIDKKFELYYMNGLALYYYQKGDKEPTLISNDVVAQFGNNSEEAMRMIAIGSSLDECKYVLVKSDKMIEMKGFAPEYVGDQIFYDMKSSLAYFVAYDTYNGEKGTLYSMGFGFTGKGTVTSCATDVVSVEYIDHDNIYVLKDADNGTSDLYLNGNLIARNVMEGSLSYTADQKAVVFAYNVSSTEGNRELVLYNGSEIKEIGSCLNDSFVAISAKKVYFLQNKEDGSVLMQYNGNKAKVYLKSVQNWNYLFY